jgi:hypothetical protein
MSHHESRPLPSVRQLLKATTIAILVAIAVLITTVLPAEYGIDPTGLGERLGLTRLAVASESAAAAVAVSEAIPSAPATADSAIVRRTEIPTRDTATITLPPGKGVEVKARMKRGDDFVFHWRASAEVGVDMHGERPDAAEGEYTSYWLEQSQAAASGSFTAPFDGSHGWYWHNKGSEPVTVTLEVTGFFQDQLYRP